MEWIWEPFRVSAEYQPKHKGFSCCAPANQAFRWLPKSWSTSVALTAWCWIHILIHSIWRLSIPTYIYGVDMGTIPCGLGASTYAQGLHFLYPSESGFQLTSQIMVIKCGPNCMMPDPYPNPQHMKVVNHLVYVWIGYGNHSMWVWNINHSTRASFAVLHRIRFSADFPNLG